jgi:hypothetical protein
MVLSFHDRRPYVWLAISITSAILGWFGDCLFSQSQLIQDIKPPWRTTGGFNRVQFVGLVVQTYLFPFSIVSIVVAAPQLIKMNTSSGRKTRVLSVIMLALAFIAAAAYLGGADEVLHCGIIFCLYEPNDDDGFDAYSMAPWRTTNALIYLATALYIGTAVWPHFWRSARSALSDRATGRSSRTDNAEAAPLLSKPSELLSARSGDLGGRRDSGHRALRLHGGDTAKNPAYFLAGGGVQGPGGPHEALPEATSGAGAAGHADTAWAAHFTRRARARAVRRRYGLVAIFLVGLPLLALAAALLPDSWIYFSVSGKRGPT